MTWMDEPEFRNILYFALGSCSTSEGAPNTHSITDRGSVPLISRDLAEPGILSIFIRLDRRDIDRWDENLETKYPLIKHKKRECFNSDCQKEITFNEFWMSNKRKMKLEQLEKIWESPYVELFCCSCFRKEKLKERIQAKEYRLINKSKRICNKFGFDLIHDKTRKEDEGSVERS